MDPRLRLEVQDGDSKSVGNFLVLGYGAESAPGGWPADRVSWGASAVSAVAAGAPGLTARCEKK